jgi:hypothetical protein
MVLLKALGPHSKLSLIHNDYRPGRISSFECTQKRDLDSRWKETCRSGTTTAGVERLDAIPAEETVDCWESTLLRQTTRLGSI